MCKTHQLGKYTYKLKKNQFKKPITKSYLFSLMYNPETRKSYDTSIKECRLLEGNSDCYLLQTSYHSPIFFISEREATSKRVTFMLNDDFYCYSSSVDEKVKLIYI